MTVNVANTANNNTFDYWRNRTNELAYYMSVYAVTANSSNAAVGNAAITGIFSSNSLVSNGNANVVTYVSVGNADSSVFQYSYVNTSFIHVGNVTVNTTTNSTSMRTYNVYIGSNVVVNTSVLHIGDSTSNSILNKTLLNLKANTTVNSSVNATALRFSNGAAMAEMTYDTLVFGNTVVNSTIITTANTSNSGFTANTTAITVGADIVVNTSTISVGNSVANIISNSTFINVRNETSNVRVTTNLITLANSTTTANLTSDFLLIGTSSINSTAASIGSGNVVANVGGVFIFNGASLNSNLVYIGTGAVNNFINTTAIVSTNGSFTTTINSTSISSNGLLTVTGNTEIGISGSGYANVKNDLFVRGNLSVSGNLTYTGVSVGDVMPSGNTYLLGNNTNRWTLFAMTANVSGNVTVSDSLFVNTQIRLGNASTTSVITVVAPNLSQRNQGNTFLNANGSWVALQTPPYSNNVVATSGTGNQLIDSVALGTFAYDYTIQVNDSTGSFATKILVSTNTTNITSTEYATINALPYGVFTTAVINATSGGLFFAPVNSATSVRFTRIQTA